MAHYDAKRNIINVNREKPDYRKIEIKNNFVSIEIEFSSSGGGVGLPFGVAKNVKEYSRNEYSYSDFTIEITAIF